MGTDRRVSPPGRGALWLARRGGVEGPLGPEGYPDSVREAPGAGPRRCSPVVGPVGGANFAPGCRGSRFWEVSADAESVIVTETGCVCFTGDNAFRSWADIFGSDWVREQQGGAVGEAIANMWWEDGTSVYWRRYPSGEIGAMRTIADVKLHLRVLGLRDEIIKGQDLTPVEGAIYACQMTRRADYVVPLIYRPNDIVYHNNRSYLNTSRVRVTAPIPDPRGLGRGVPLDCEVLRCPLGSAAMGVLHLVGREFLPAGARGQTHDGIGALHCW
jgi:hypothetical protein